MNAAAAKRPYIVRIVRTEDDKLRGGFSAGPFVVEANSPTGAFRIVRNRFGQYFTNHVAREARALECEGVISDRIGELLAHYNRHGDLRQSYSARFAA